MADAVCRSAPLAYLVPQVQDEVTELVQLWESKAALTLPQLLLSVTVLVGIELVNDILITSQHGLLEPHLHKDLLQVSIESFRFLLQPSEFFKNIRNRSIDFLLARINIPSPLLFEMKTDKAYLQAGS